MNKRLDGKIAIVTGATSGIGEAVVKLFAKEGAKVVFAARRTDKGEELEKKFRATGGDVTFIRTDVTKIDDIKNLVAKTIELYGQIDVLVNNAGILRKYDSTNMDEERDFDEVFNTNVKSYFLLSKEVIPHMLKKGKGSIINTASVGSEIAVPFHASYSASKGAIRQFTKSLAVEYAKGGIRVNAVLPGLTRSEMVPEGGDFEINVLSSVPMGRSATSEEIAMGFLFLASDEASYCTGTLLIMDGGLTSI
jgi:NAD(P)-dependent dehydrogenase (short-subunit alcohol dehydrogenase family)